MLPDDIQAEINVLLAQAEQSSATVRGQTTALLLQFRQECQVVINWQRTAGRDRVLKGEAPDVVQEEANRRVGEARQRLKERLEMLLRTTDGHGPRSVAGMSEPKPIGAAIENILSGVLPDLLAEFRVMILQEHANTVLALRGAVRSICIRRLREESGELLDRGFDKKAAEQIAALRLEPEFVLLRRELQEQLDALEESLRQRMKRLLEWWVTTDRNPDNQAPAS